MLPAHASGAERRAGQQFVLDVSAQTSMPLSVGVEAQLVSPVGISAHFSVGHTPNAYMDAIASMLSGAGVVRPNIQPLVSESIANGAWNLRVGLGYALPAGFELAAGYTLLAGGAELTPNAIEAATGQRLTWPGMTNVPLGLTLHALHARIGWRFVVEQHLVLGVALGWTHVVAASVHVEVPAEWDAPDGPADRMETAIAEALGKYGFTPEIIVSMGYRF